MMRFAIFAVVFTLAPVVLAADSKILSKNTYLAECPCSPSKRGFNNNAFNQLKEFRDKIDEKVKEEKGKDGAVLEVIQQLIQKEASTNFQACAGNHGWEECVNADAAFRRGNCYPDCTSFCTFDVKTWNNLGENGNLVQACDKTEEFRSTELDKDRTPDFLAVSPPPLKPTVTPTPGTSSADSEDGDGDGKSGSGSGEEGTDGADPNAAPAPGDAVTPSSVPDNGCIALEHLVGLPKQHRNDRISEVLCGRGFCATANHAIIFDGAWTSMGRLCSQGWKCVTSRKMVNNMNVFKLRRAQVGDITMTPYDVRFPRWGVFLLQALEKMLYFAVDFSLTITLAAIFVHASLRSVRSRLI